MAGDFMNIKKYSEQIRITGLKISYYRRLNKFNQTELAEKIGITPQLLSKIEGGKLPNGAPLMVYLKLADVLRIDFEKLFKEF